MKKENAPIVALPPCPLHLRADYKIRCAMIVARIMAALTVMAIAAGLALLLSLLSGCGMLQSIDTWQTIGEGLARACARCHTEGGGLKNPLDKGKPGPTGHASCPIECPISAGR